MKVDMINYAIVALTIDQVDPVIGLLKAEGMDELADWIENNRADIYKTSPEKWTPYKNKSIDSIIDEEGEHFLSMTHLISDLRDDFFNIHTLSEVRVFFVDALSMYIEKYQNLASRIDFACCDGETKSCCFIINNELPQSIQQELEKKYDSLWPAVSCKYDEGCMNRITFREKELKNFTNQLLKLFLSNPHFRRLDERFGSFEKFPTLTQE